MTETLNETKENNEADEDTMEQQETFEEPIDPCIEFSSRWGLWEHYEGGDFEMSMSKVAWFGDAVSFAEAWVNLPHSDIKKYFYNSDTQSVQL